ncbi:hypothetical protein O2W53_00965 [Modestobacter sp. VKM Ac-2978]|uniref:hypothetical protein n=1 Tax=unclassified Modestobacter TaxID=2643866 RepID=UPI0022AB9789|nr:MULTISPECIES: hypothetical protein [unclassified Modestobacter]MCZ2813385.1 hypothetical protein [Modestobacter sp. VKM Ac-2979]MCZ2842423.1 hypothetical protein [Modestobacter sp. VKM Ac-2980]MCZ2846545.1 hypothetical protein [Modestobacter sp. VKM Ac-2978]
MQLSSVVGDTRRRPIATDHARRSETHLDCPCAGDTAVHARHAGEAPSVGEAQPGTEGMVECPECGEPSSHVRIATWGHCRVCRTADSRATQPLRW